METAVDKNLAEIRSLYIEYCEIFGSWIHTVTEPDGRLHSLVNKAKYQARMQPIRQNLLTKIDHLIENTTDTERARYIVIKSLVLNDTVDELSYLCSYYSDYLKAKPIIEESLMLLTPLTDEVDKLPMILFVYMEANLISMAVQIHLDEHKSKEQLDFSSKMQTVYEKFLERFKIEDAWDFKKTFGFTDEETEKFSNSIKTCHSRRNLREIIAINSYKLALRNIKNKELCIKYGLSSFYGFRENLYYNITNKQGMLHFLSQLSGHLIAVHRFKQANHLLGVAMYHLLKILRDSCPPEATLTFKGIQGHLSITFAKLGEAIVKLSLSHRQNIESRNEIEEIFMNSETENLVGIELMEEGAEKYVAQYPIKLLESDEEIKNVANKSLKWIQRAENLDNTFGKVKESIPVIKQSLNEMLTSLEQK